MKKITDLIVSHLGVDPDQVTPDAHIIRDLGADSFDTMEMQMSLEDAFNIEITDEEMEAVHTVGDMQKLISGKVAA